MKNLALGFAAALAIQVSANAAETPNLSQVNNSIIASLRAEVQAFNLLNWQVGEYHDISVDSAFGPLGGGTKSVTKDEKAQNAFWYVTELDLMGQKQKTEALMSRTDGKVLKLIVNGKEEDPNGGGDGKIEIIEQSETTVTVPAGKFDCMYVKAKITSQGQESEIEAWINPVDVNLDGMIKLNINGGMIPLSLVLQKFGKK